MPLNTRDKYLQQFISGVLEEGSNNASKLYFDDPTTVGFNLLFEFEGKESPLFNESGHGESAIAYLESIEEGDRSYWNSSDPEVFRENGGRAAALKRFKENLKKIVNIYPYFFTSISGLENPYNFDPNVGYDSERHITINTMESIDMRISRLVEDYVFAYYDVFYRRQMIPGNLLYFSFSIILSEIRNFRSFVRGVTGTNNSPGKGTEVEVPDGQGGGNISPVKNENQVSVEGKGLDKDINSDKSGQFPYNMKDINANLSTFIFKYKKNRFDFSQSNGFMGDLSNESPEMVSNSFSIHTGRLKTKHKMTILDMLVDVATDDGREQNMKPTVGGKKFTNESDVKKTLDSKSVSNEDFLGKLNREAERIRNKNVGIAEDVFKAEADAFLQDNDPRAVASRTLRDKLGNRLDQKFKNFLFGNALLNEATGRIANAREEIISKILEGRNLREESVETSDKSDFESDLDEKDVSRDFESEESTLGQKDVGNLDENPNDLDEKDIGEQSVNPSDLDEKDVGEQSTNPNDLDNKDTGEQSVNPSDLDEKDVGERSGNSDDLNRVETGEQSENSGDLNRKEVGELSGYTDDLNEKNVGERSENSNDLNEKNVSEESSNPDDLSSKDVGDRSAESPDLGEKEFEGRSQNRSDIGNKDFGVVSGFARRLGNKNLGDFNELSRNTLGEKDVGKLTMDELETLGIKEVAGMTIQQLKDLGAVTVDDINENLVEDLGEADEEEVRNEKMRMFSDNINGFENAPLSSITEAMIKSHLGNIVNEKTDSTNGEVRTLGNVFGDNREKDDNDDQERIGKEE